MTAFFLIFFGIILIFKFLSHKYRNPYKTTFIFGKKGAGKSLLLVHYMLKYQRAGWTVYTDMKDIKIPGVRIIDSAHLQWFRPAEGSAIFLDEVGITMDNRDFKNFPPGLRDFFKYVRKMKCVVFMNSQSFDVDKKVRDTTDEMILQVSIADCISLSRPIRRTITLTDPMGDAESRIADKLSFRSILSWKFLWMPNYFKYFNSSEMPRRELLPYKEPSEVLPASRSFIQIGKEVCFHVKRQLSYYFNDRIS